uniref:hypothetical protein n=1 Tax=Acinetobacter tianfuensis TaxID=2419603 RepID=UPI0038996000
ENGISKKYKPLLDHSIIICKESFVKCGHMSSLILISNRVLKRLFLMFQSVCIQFTLLYVRIKNKGGTLFHNLRFRNQRKRKCGSPETGGQLSNRKSVHDRPVEIEQPA